MSTLQTQAGAMAIPTMQGIVVAGEMQPIISVAGSVPLSEATSNRTRPVLRMKGVGDIYGMDERGEVIIVHYSDAELFDSDAANVNATGSKTRTVSRRTKTTSAEKGRATDDRVVHLGLFVVLLGVLSIVV